jgi:hypothetical protein
MDDQKERDQPQDTANNNVLPPEPIAPAAPEREKPTYSRNKSPGGTNPADNVRKITWLEYVLAATNIGLVAVGIWALTVYSGQLKVMQGTLEQMRSSGSVATDQTWQAIGNMNWLARGMDTSTRQAQQAMATSQAQSKTALDASVEAARLDQRAWVGLAEFTTIGGAETTDNGHEGFSYKSVQIAIRNSGKTPAINLSVVTLQTARDWREKVGDYDAMTAQIRREQEELSARLLEDQIRKNPTMEDRLRALDRDFRARITQSETDLFPARQVLAPGIVITQGTGGVSWDVQPKLGLHLDVYIFGKITYNDIFTGTPPHITKFCLKHMGGIQFTSCPAGNYMD